MPSPLVVLLDHEAFQRREATVHDEFEVAELSLGECDVREGVRLCEELRPQGSVPDVEILENGILSVRYVGHGVSGCARSVRYRWIGVRERERDAAMIGVEVGVSSE